MILLIILASVGVLTGMSTMKWMVEHSFSRALTSAVRHGWTVNELVKALKAEGFNVSVDWERIQK